jgi:hypothetical protein
VSRDALEALEASDLDVDVSLAWLVKDEVGLDETELIGARRRAMFVLAAGGDPHRDLSPNSVAAERLADELDSPARRVALDAALAALDTSGLPRIRDAVATLRADPERAWRTLALALLADEIAD